jgi:hypothetical protein
MMIKGEMLEILMGKYLDGQITPGENRMLQEALEADDDARELFEQLQILHQQCEEAVDSEVLSKGQDFDEVFERAWQRRKVRVVRVPVPSGALKFVAGLAAGILIGIGVHLAISVHQLRNPNPGPMIVVREAPESQTRVVTHVPPGQSEGVGGMTRNVDGYSWIGKSGEELFIESYRQSVVNPAVRRRGI